MFECKYFHCDDAMILRMELAYPGVEILRELRKAEQWLDANPRRRKENYKRFLAGWLGKAHKQLLAVQLKETVRDEIRRTDANAAAAPEPQGLRMKPEVVKRYWERQARNSVYRKDGE